MMSPARVSTAPWPGPGDSEGPVAPLDEDPGPDADFELEVGVDAPPFVATTPWPGPGNSEGPS